METKVCIPPLPPPSHSFLTLSLAAHEIGLFLENSVFVGGFPSELHLSHNRITTKGALSLLLALERAEWKEEEKEEGEGEKGEEEKGEEEEKEESKKDEEENDKTNEEESLLDSFPSISSFSPPSPLWLRLEFNVIDVVEVCALLFLLLVLSLFFSHQP